MAQSLSSKKRNRQNDTRQARNVARKSALKTQARSFTEAVSDKNAEAAGDAFIKLAKAIDQIAAKGTIHRNKAARQKSRYQKQLNAIKSA